ncbi:MAG: ChaN family lipoprotein [Gammaproteobacteria bacterium]|nr:ChaN family lipoprotein [Gammaproteobacteria bacterium]
MSQQNTPSVNSYMHKKPQFLLALNQSLWLLAFSLFVTLAAAREQNPADITMLELPVADLSRTSSLHGILHQIKEARVLLVGETHTRYDHHLVQLEVLKHLYLSKQRVALGVEWFQQPFQKHLDDYIAGKITETEMLHRTEYFQRWGYDYRLYRPIIQYAREKQIPIIALNASQELISALGKGGFEQLPAELQSQLPDSYDFTDRDYVERLRDIFKLHPGKSRKFANFLVTQLTWDESMATRTVDYLQQHPDLTMLVLAGSGHIRFGSGIPNRIKRRLDSKQFSILVNDDSLSLSPDMADFLVLSANQSLEPSGLLGVFVETIDGRVVIQGFVQNSVVKEAGITAGSVIVGINNKPVNNYTDLKLTLIDNPRGETIELHYLENGDVRKSMKITLR